jgi:hypothetical protein
VLLVHGLSHALPGMRAMDAVAGWSSGATGEGSVLAAWLVAVLWAVAATGTVAAAFGLLGARPFRRVWRFAALVGLMASMVLLLWQRPAFWLPGVLVDVVLGVALFGGELFARLRGEVQPALWPVAPNGAAEPQRKHRIARLSGDVLACALVAWCAIVILARPLHMRWGVTDAELAAVLPGDELQSVEPRYSIHHAVTVNAPASSVWPWLVQLGYDRGGFYSLSWLENLLGLGIRNAEVINPEWQHLATGDSVFATPPGWLGIDRRLGWRVALAEPGRVLVLEKWGAFVLEPIDATTTRLIVRTRGAGADRLTGLAMGWFGLLLLEPAHFIMERSMLLGIRARAERMALTVSASAPLTGG